MLVLQEIWPWKQMHRLLKKNYYLRKSSDLVLCFFKDNFLYQYNLLKNTCPFSFYVFGRNYISFSKPPDDQNNWRRRRTWSEKKIEKCQLDKLLYYVDSKRRIKIVWSYEFYSSTYIASFVIKRTALKNVIMENKLVELTI